MKAAQSSPLSANPGGRSGGQTGASQEGGENSAAPYDVVIAGGGMSGVLAAARLASAQPGLKILLLERESRLGGRLQATESDKHIFSYGLNAVSAPLVQGALQILRSDPEAAGIAEDALVGLLPPRHKKIGVLAGNRLTEVGIDLWFKPKGARTLGGLAAARQWPEIEGILGLSEDTGSRAGATAKDRKGAMTAASSEQASQTATDGLDDDELAPASDDDEADRAHAFAHYWKKPRKAPAAMVLEHFAAAIGVPDLWSASPQAIAERVAVHSGAMYAGSWVALFQALTAMPSFQGAVTVRTNCMIGDAFFDKETHLWTIESEAGVDKARALIVAQPPWQATAWLRRSQWPAAVLQIPSKSRPVSVVVLSDVIVGKTEGELPNVMVVPSERVQIIRNGPHDICFQATIDFELSLQAPAVVKAVRSLKRARKKLLTLYPGLVAEGNHIALQTVAWAQSPAHADRRWLERLAKKPFQTKTLAFCGDAYGSHYDGDKNILTSLASACDVIGGYVSEAARSQQAAVVAENGNEKQQQIPT